MKKLKERVVAVLEELWAKEPLRVISGAVTGIVALLAALHVAVATGEVEVIVELVLPLLFGELARTQVSPKATPGRPGMSEQERGNIGLVIAAFFVAPFLLLVRGWTWLTGEHG